MPAADMWGSVLEIERQLRLFASSVPALDAVHLRFADAGTWAAARWTRAAGIPCHFTLAPDPYVPIRAAQAAGSFSRSSFAQAEAQEHYLFRAHVLDWMVEHAAGLALLPRPRWEEDAPLFFGIAPGALASVTPHRRRIRVIAEGIDTGARDPIRTPEAANVWEQALSEHLTRHPYRRNKPALLTVGRLHEVKGVARLVEAWAGDPMLCDSFNLIVVGGNLVKPSVQEQRVLDAIAATMRRYPPAAGGLILLGSTPHDEVGRILATLRTGIPGAILPHGIYVCASDKEEFGLAILEAMAAELLVVAPNEGGPPTYIRHGATGFLADTQNIGDLRRTIHLVARVREDSEERRGITETASRMVREHYSVERMAAELVELYTDFAPVAVAGEVAS
jgi:glycosyltransferase involved in cell wall biosynthesis